MLTINLQNIEELVFYNKQLQQAIPELYNIFQTWNMGRAIPAMKNMCQKAIFEFMDQVTDEHIAKIEHHFNTTVKIVKTNSHLVKSGKFDLECCECDLNQFEGYENWFICRNDSTLSIQYWR